MIPVVVVNIKVDFELNVVNIDFVSVIEVGIFGLFGSYWGSLCSAVDVDS